MEEHDKGQAEYRSQLNQIRMSYLYDATKLSEQATVDLAISGLKSLLIANGGALIALLTFIGNFYEQPTVQQGLWWAFGLFAVGLVSALFATLFAYFSQGEASNQSYQSAERIFFSLWGHFEDAASFEPDETKSMKRAAVFRWLSIGSATTSGVAFAVGIGFGLAALVG